MSHSILPNGTAAIDGDTLNEWILKMGVNYDPKIASVLTRIIKDRGVTHAVDAGGHIGATTRPMLDAGCKVITFEPNPDAVACLAINCPGATVVNKALSDATGRMSYIKLPMASSNHLAEPGDPVSDIVEVTTLDDYYDSVPNEPLPGLIKWDIEGSEFKALKGAERTITKCRPAMLLEINVVALKLQGAVPGDVYGWLLRHGYRWSIIEISTTFDSQLYNIEAMP